MYSSALPACIDACGPCDDCCTCEPPADHASERRRLARMAWGLTAVTILWNGIEAGVALIGGIIARSVALVAFGLDSLIEVSSATVIVWWLARGGADHDADEHRERLAVRLIALSFFAIAAYVTWDAVRQ